MAAVVAFGNNLGATVQSALLAIVGSVVGAALGILIIALLSGLAMGFSFDNHPKTMVQTPPSPHLCPWMHTTICACAFLTSEVLLLPAEGRVMPMCACCKM